VITELDPSKQNDASAEFESELRRFLIGQDKACVAITRLYKLLSAGFNAPNKPIGNLLFLGPTGSGKTHAMEIVADYFWKNPEAMIKIDCAEFQADHEISKLIGAPPGYLGHSGTEKILSQEKIDKLISPQHPFAIILFDEIEKASERLFQLLLGVLDKATLTTGDNKKVKLNKCIIVMTSNLGTNETQRIANMMGFKSDDSMDLSKTNAENERISMQAVHKQFSKEFVNRIDEIVVFNTLTTEDLKEILEIELRKLQMHIIHDSTGQNQFVFHCSTQVKEFFLKEGFDPEKGARPLKRVLEKHLLLPFAELVATSQIKLGDEINVVMKDGHLKFWNIGNRL
jgi:ATP-dependent Clp protease ATP-binding subunit ClpA